MNDQLVYPFIFLFLLLYLLQKWRRPKLNPLKAKRFWILFIILSMFLYAAIILMVLYALGGGRYLK